MPFSCGSSHKQWHWAGHAAELRQQPLPLHGCMPACYNTVQPTPQQQWVIKQQCRDNGYVVPCTGCSVITFSYGNFQPAWGQPAGPHKVAWAAVCTCIANAYIQALACKEAMQGSLMLMWSEWQTSKMCMCMFHDFENATLTDQEILGHHPTQHPLMPTIICPHWGRNW